MPSFLHLNSFKIYNILLFFVFSIIVNNNLPNLLSTSFYCIFYLFIIYLGIFQNRISLYFIYFIYAIMLDILLLNEIGPHLIIFFLILVILNISFKYLYNLSSLKVYFLIILIQIFMISAQMVISYLFYNIHFNYNNFFEIIILSIILSYPILIIFSKLDKIN